MPPFATNHHPLVTLSRVKAPPKDDLDAIFPQSKSNRRGEFFIPPQSHANPTWDRSTDNGTLVSHHNNRGHGCFLGQGTKTGILDHFQIQFMFSRSRANINKQHLQITQHAMNYAIRYVMPIRDVTGKLLMQTKIWHRNHSFFRYKPDIKVAQGT